MASSGVVATRVLARAKRVSDSVPVQLKFTQSVIDYLCGDGKRHQIEVFFWTGSNPTHLVLSDRPRDSKDGPIQIKRPSFCPIHNLPESRYGDLDPGVRERGVDTGAAVFVESADNKVLLIRRAKHLRTFPNIWVPAGGHIEQGETVAEAGFRELREESGLNITDDMLESPPTTLCLWESSFPPKLTAGLPKRHHVVVYLYCKLRAPHTADSIQLKPDHNEVDACAWFDHQVISGIVSASEEGRTTGSNVSGAIRAQQVNKDGSTRPVDVPFSVLYAKSDGEVEDKERVSTGTKWGLEMWLRNTAASKP